MTYLIMKMSSQILLSKKQLQLTIYLKLLTWQIKNMSESEMITLTFKKYLTL